MTEHHTIDVRLGERDGANLRRVAEGTKLVQLQLMRRNGFLDHGIGQCLRELGKLGLRPNETAIDLLILAAAVTAADTKIERNRHGLDGWTRQIDLFVPVNDPEVWNRNALLLQRTLEFLTGDYWRVHFRGRPKSAGRSLGELFDPVEDVENSFDHVCLFSGGLDSFVGAINLLDAGKRPLFMSHYKDVSTSGQRDCMSILRKAYSSPYSRHIAANVSFNVDDLPELSRETSTRGRSFIFLALATVAASAIGEPIPVIVPENGFISLNVPLTNLRIGSLSTRTTHPFYMKCWGDLTHSLGIGVNLNNPYQFRTKGEMLQECRDKPLLRGAISRTISCSSCIKTRYHKDKVKRTYRHCGYCVPCLIRRAAIATAFDIDPTQYAEIPRWDTAMLDATKAVGKDIRAFRMQYRQLQRSPQLIETSIYRPGPLPPAGEQDQYIGVFRRGLQEVGTLVDQVAFHKM